METFSYINEQNDFDAWLDFHELPSSCIAVWFALIRISNKLGRRRTFNASLSLISVKAGQMDDRTIRKARNRLQEEGLISFESRRGKRSAVYTLLPISDERTARRTEQNVAIHVSSAGHIHKSKSKSKSNTTTTVVTEPTNQALANLVKTFSANIHPITPIEAQKLEADLSDYGETWTKAAIEEAVMNGVPKMSYIEGILKGWKSKGSMTRGKKQEHHEIEELVPF